MKFFDSHKVYKIKNLLADLENDEFLKQMAEDIKVLITNDQKVELNFGRVKSIPDIFAIEIMAKIMFFDPDKFATYVDLKNIENKDIRNTIDENIKKYSEKHGKK